MSSGKSKASEKKGICPECGKEVKGRGLVGHIRMAHPSIGKEIKMINRDESIGVKESLDFGKNLLGVEEVRDISKGFINKQYGKDRVDEVSFEEIAIKPCGGRVLYESEGSFLVKSESVWSGDKEMSFEIQVHPYTGLVVGYKIKERS